MPTRTRPRYPSNLNRYQTPTLAWDPFASNPIMRSLATFVISAALVIVPMALLDTQLEALLMVSFGWLAIVAMVFSLPVLLISLIEAGWTKLSRRIHPSLDQLDLSPRVRNLLRRYGYESIDHVDQTSDDTFLLLTNFDPMAVRELRRAISIWKYRRWQDAGFPADWY